MTGFLAGCARFYETGFNLSSFGQLLSRVSKQQRQCPHKVKSVLEQIAAPKIPTARGLD